MNVKVLGLPLLNEEWAKLATGLAAGLAATAAMDDWAQAVKSILEKTVTPEPGPRDWSPRTGKCLCVKPCRG